MATWMDRAECRYSAATTDPLRSRKTPQFLEDQSRMLDLTEVKLR
jgi:hypothetical protein